MLEWEDKEDSPQLAAWIQQFGIKNYLNAAQINELRDFVNGLGSTTINTNITIVSTLPITPELNKLYKLPDDSLQFYNGTEWVVVGSGGSSELEIIDPIPSTVVSTNISTLVNEYEIGSFLNKKSLSFEFLVHKTIIVNETINVNIALYNLTTNEEFFIGFVSSNTGSQHTGLRRSCAIDNVSNVIRVINAGIDSVIISNLNVLEFPINFTDNYALRVYLRNSWTTGGIRQYYGQINLK